MANTLTCTCTGTSDFLESDGSLTVGASGWILHVTAAAKPPTQFLSVTCAAP